MKKTTLNRMMAFASVLVLSGAVANTATVAYAFYDFTKSFGNERL